MKENDIIDIIKSNSIPELLNKIGKFYPNQSYIPFLINFEFVLLSSKTLLYIVIQFIY